MRALTAWAIESGALAERDYSHRDVVDKLGSVPTDRSDRPLEPQVLSSVDVQQGT